MLTYFNTQLDKQPRPCQSVNFFLLAIEIDSGIAHNLNKHGKTQIFWIAEKKYISSSAVTKLKEDKVLEAIQETYSEVEPRDW